MKATSEAKAAHALADIIVRTLEETRAPGAVVIVGLQEALVRLAMARKGCSRLEAYEGVIGMLCAARDEAKKSAD